MRTMKADPTLPNRPGAPLYLVAALAAACLLGACDGCDCGGATEAEDAGAAVPAVPEGAIALTTGYAERLPAGTQAIAVLRDFGAANGALQTLRPRFAGVLDLAAIEAQFRELFGVDIAQPASFRDVGIAYEGGAALSAVREQPLIAFYLSDPNAFVARALDVLRRPPFNLRAPLREETVGDVAIRHFAQRPSDPIEVSLITTPGMAFVVRRQVPSVNLEEVARAIAETTAATSMASTPHFASQVQRHGEAPGFLFVDVPAMLAFVLERYADQLSAVQRFTFEEAGRAITSAAANAWLEGETVRVEGYVTVEAELAERTRNIGTPVGGHPHFERFYPDSAFFGLRIAVDPRTAWETVLAFQGERGGPALLRRLERYDALLGEGRTVQTDVVDALGGNALLLLNRLAPISLGSADNIEEYADGVGLLLLVQLRDRAAALTLLDAMVAAEPETFSRTEDGGDVRYHNNDPEHSLGDIVIRGDTMFVMSDYMRRRMSGWARPAGAQHELPAAVAAVPELNALLAGDTTSGAFLRFAPLMPIAVLMGLPESVRAGLASLDTLADTARPEGDGLALSGRLELTDAE
jgi:hypothetical protein